MTLLQRLLIRQVHLLARVIPGLFVGVNSVGVLIQWAKVFNPLIVQPFKDSTLCVDVPCGGFRRIEGRFHAANRVGVIFQRGDRLLRFAGHSRVHRISV